MGHVKHRTCEKCGGPLKPGTLDCPACDAAFWKRFRTRLPKAVFWGGVTPLAFFLVVTFVLPVEPHEDFTFLPFMAFMWPFLTFLLLMSGGGGNGGGGNGGGGNGGGGNGGG